MAYHPLGTMLCSTALDAFMKVHIIAVIFTVTAVTVLPFSCGRAIVRVTAPLKLKKSADHRASNSGWGWGVTGACKLRCCCCWRCLRQHSTSCSPATIVGSDSCFTDLQVHESRVGALGVRVHRRQGRQSGRLHVRALPVLAASCLFLSARLQVLPRCTAAAGRGG